VARLRFSPCGGKASEGAVARKPRGGGGELEALEEGDNWWGGLIRELGQTRWWALHERKSENEKKIGWAARVTG
jgi:hypothetical protein